MRSWWADSLNGGAGGVDFRLLDQFAYRCYAAYIHWRGHDVSQGKLQTCRPKKNSIQSSESPPSFQAHAVPRRTTAMAPAPPHLCAVNQECGDTLQDIEQLIGARVIVQQWSIARRDVLLDYSDGAPRILGGGTDQYRSSRKQTARLPRAQWQRVATPQVNP